MTLSGIEYEVQDFTGKEVPIPELLMPTVPGTLQPVDLFHRRDHKFVKRDIRGCGECGRGKARMVHVGTPASLNVQGSSANKFVYQAQKQAWEERLTELLEASGLPKPVGHILAEGQLCFPDRQKRDQGNFRFLLEKALGDALVKGGWLADDTWSQYEFGRLRAAYSKGECWTALTLFPSAEPLALDL